jgi:hypothetical protein
MVIRPDSGHVTRTIEILISFETFGYTTNEKGIKHHHRV